MSADPANAPIRVVGAGPIALAFALFLVRRGVPASSIAIDPAPSADAEPPPALAARTLAVSHGTRQLLERVAPMPDAGTIERVEVSLLGHAGRTRIVAADLDVPALGHVVRYGPLLRALARAALAHHWAAPGPDTTPSLVVHAEGDAGDDARVREFGQSALLGEVVAARAPAAMRHTAFERFTPDGPLALLPLPDASRWTMVWCDRHERCVERRDEPDRAALSRELAARFGDALGPLAIDGTLSVAPLARRARRRVADQRDVWIGNAAQSLHPVAGQGLNLGVRDAFELADALAPVRLRGAPLDRALDAWRRGRRVDRTMTIALTDLMAASFTWPLARGLQSPLLAALDAIEPLRRPLAAQLMFGKR